MLDKITLITGLIGSGKTLRAVWYIDQEVKAGRSVYACNLDGLNIPGVIPWDDPREWQQLPPGSLLVVDEAQRFWRARRAGEVPAELQAMETSRHDAVSMLLITQQPKYLDVHLRGLVTRHEHLYRRYGAQATTVYTWERCVEDPNNAAEKDGADQSLFVYPKHLYSAYKSAEQHTTKLRIGTRAKLIIAALVFAAGLLLHTVFKVSDSMASEPIADQEKATAAGSAGRSAPASPAVVAPLDALAYTMQFYPRDPTRPYSAPAWDQRPVVSDPQLVCIIGKTCHCMTEQGTRWILDQATCIAYVRNGGAYNPYKAPEPDQPPMPGNDQPFMGPGQSPAVKAQSAAVTGATASEFGEVAAYGGPGIDAY